MVVVNCVYFGNLHVVCSVFHPTIEEACMTLGLLKYDKEFERNVDYAYETLALELICIHIE